MTHTVRGLFDAYWNGRIEEIARFVDGDENINIQDADGMTLLHHFAANAARPGIRLLVASGKCDYLIRDNHGRYASDLAIEWSRDYVVGRLLSKHQARQAFQRGVPSYVPRS